MAMTIQIETESIRTMAGEVKYQTKSCPYYAKDIRNTPVMVGSSMCQLCKYHGGMEGSENIVCNHN